MLENTAEEVFVEVEPILRSALDGHNVCILAYGQTGTGKTFTMVSKSSFFLFVNGVVGIKWNNNWTEINKQDGTNEKPGIIPRALKELFIQASPEGESLTFSMSMLEVYMGSLRDLLAPRPTCRAYEPVTRW